MAANPLNKKRNPLLDHVIVEHLFSVIPFDTKNFANFRLVCKLWCKESLPIWRKNAQIFVTDAKKMNANNHIHYNKYICLFDSKYDLYQLRKHPFRKFAIKHWDLRFDGRKNSGRLKFWEKIGPLMTSLYMEECDIYRLEDFRKVLFEITPNLESLFLIKNIYRIDRPDESEVRLDPNRDEHRKPEFIQKNLTTLEICLEVGDLFHFSMEELVNDDYIWNVEELPITWMELLIHFPMIQNMWLSWLSEYDGWDALEECLVSMQLIRDALDEPQYFSSLTHLNMNNVGIYGYRRFPRDIAKLLERLNFPLKTLNMDLGKRTSDGALKLLFETHADTLEGLKLTWRKNSQLFFNFPCGVNLSALKILEASDPSILNLSFLKHTPNLRILSMYNKGDIYHPNPQENSIKKMGETKPGVKPKVFEVISKTNFEAFNNGLVLPYMEKFLMSEEICDGSQIELLSKLMPNLKHLRIGLGNEGFQMVCKVWKKLEQLQVNPFQVDEMGLLGVSEGKRYHLPNLTDLKDLRVLQLGSSYVPNLQYCLSTSSIINGVFSLKYLNGFNACLSKSIPDEVRTELATRYPLSDNVLNQP
ncbi:unnamed protein product [Orchesella dallaii]|uniref:F-box domain-containing protein n=1 Tax=Orchesella dallaii TaxID=48710 RepID=A0ABP1RUT2_9HEXA